MASTALAADAEYRRLLLSDSEEAPAERALEWERCRDDFLHFGRYWVYVVNKDKERVLFNLNPVQRLYRSRQTNDDIILKARKVGISTYKFVEGLWKDTFFTDERAVMCAHMGDASNELFYRLKFSFSLLPPFLKPEVVKDRFNILEFGMFPEECPRAGEPNNSRFQIMTAEGHEPGRAFDVSFIHFSEYAMFKHPKAVKGSLISARIHNAPCTIESTAMGFNDFQDEYAAAKEGIDTKFTAHFFPWTEDPTCNAALRNPTRWNPHVKGAVDDNGLTPTQGQFYQDRMEDLHSVDLLKQEWPLNDLECFLSTGRVYFDMGMVQDERAKAERFTALTTVDA